MARRYMVLSDLHLCDIEDNPDGWKAYKGSRFVFDPQLDEAIERFMQGSAPDDELVLVLNGDIIDFDLVCVVPAEPPWPVRRRERKIGLDATEAKSVWKLSRVLQDHPCFVSTLARFAAAGHRIVYISGNHDTELYFEGVQRAFVGALQRSAAEAGLVFSPELISFEPWFYYRPQEIYVEHGHQYDYYTTIRYILWPVVDCAGEPTISLPMGNLSNRTMMSRMGYFNPHASDYILNVFRYFSHWLRYYALSRRSLVLPWLLGSLAVLIRLLRQKGRVLAHPPPYGKIMDRTADRKGLPRPAVRALNKLRRPPITNRLYRMIREFWIDRVLLALVMTGGTITLALVPVPLWVKLMVPLSSFPLLFLIYEWFAHGQSIFSHVREAPQCALDIARLLPARVVSFGHTHVPQLLPLGRGVSYVNTGTWTPVYVQGDPQKLKPGLRNVLLVSFDGERVEVNFDSCQPMDHRDRQ